MDWPAAAEQINKKNLRNLLLFCLAAGAVIALFFCFAKPSIPEYLAENGILDLAGWEPEQDGVLPLDGEWNFYWQQGEKMIVNVPDNWESYYIDGKPLPNFGYATYSLCVTNAAAGEAIAIKIPIISTAYQFYINDQLLLSNGTVGTNSQEHQPNFTPQTVVYTPPEADFEIILHVSNYTYAFSGLWYGLTLGNQRQIHEINQSAAVKDGFILGAFIILILYYLSLYLLLGRNNINLLLVFGCALFVARTLIHGEYLIYRLIPSISFNILTAADYLTLFWFSAAGVFVIGGLFPDEISKTSKKIVLGYVGAMSLMVLFTPVHFYTRYIFIYEVISFLFSLYMIIAVITAYLHNRPESLPMLLGVFELIVCTAHDLWFPQTSVLGYQGEMIPVGLILLLFMLPFLNARRLKIATDETVAAETAFLQAQIKPHFLYNTLGTIASYCNTDPPRARELINDFSNYLRLSFDFDADETFVTLERELSLVNSYIEIQKARFEDNLQIIFDIDQEIYVRLPLLSIQPLIENAIVHGVRKKSGSGIIRLEVHKTGDKIAVTVADDGVGIPPEKLRTLLEQKKGNGIGLYNIDRRLKKMFGKGLVIESEPGKGTTVSYTVPAGGVKRD